MSVPSVAKFAEVVSHKIPDIILLDLSLPDGQGLETLKKAMAVAPRTPIVVLTGSDDEALGLRAIQSGAEDYIPKGSLDAQVLTRMIRYAVERKRIEGTLVQMAKHDPLTQLPNRGIFSDRVDQHIAQAQRNTTRFAVLFIDLDDFKGVNDRWGHETGDQLLIQVARRLEQTVRHVDTVARLGGDEFTVLLADINESSEASGVATKLLQGLTLPFQLGEITYVGKASIGIATYPDQGRDKESLLRAADRAMYRAKTRGGRRFEFSTSSPAAPPSAEKVF